MGWLVVVAGLVALWAVQSLRAGNLRFWRAIHAHPELALMWMILNDQDWQPGGNRPGPGWRGPFRFTLAPHGNTKVWARDAAIEASQAAFLALLQAMTTEERRAAENRFRLNTVPGESGTRVHFRVSVDDLIPHRLRVQQEVIPATQDRRDHDASNNESVSEIRARARMGKQPLPTAVRQLMPYFTLRVLPGRGKAIGSARAACAKWIMLEDDRLFAADAPRENRSRLLRAWESEIGHGDTYLQVATAAKVTPVARVANTIAGSHRLRVDTWRQQVREGEQSPALLRELLEDFTVRILHDLATDGPFADVANHPPGEQVLDCFWDWLHDEPIDSPPDPRFRWRPTAE